MSKIITDTTESRVLKKATLIGLRNLINKGCTELDNFVTKIHVCGHNDDDFYISCMEQNSEQLAEYSKNISFLVKKMKNIYNDEINE